MRTTPPRGQSLTHMQNSHPISSYETDMHLWMEFNNSSHPFSEKTDELF